jgi:hypothetical protein
MVDPLASKLVPYADGLSSLRELAATWSRRVVLYQAIASTGRNPGELTIYDLVGDLWVRESLELGLAELTISAGVTVSDDLVISADNTYRTILEANTENELHLPASTDFDALTWESRSWWWRGIPRGLAE